MPGKQRRPFANRLSRDGRLLKEDKKAARGAASLSLGYSSVHSDPSRFQLEMPIFSRRHAPIDFGDARLKLFFKVISPQPLGKKHFMGR